MLHTGWDIDELLGEQGPRKREARFTVDMGPWAVRLAGHFSQGSGRASYTLRGDIRDRHGRSVYGLLRPLPSWPLPE